MSKPSFYLLGSWKTINTDTPEEWLGRVVVNYDDPGRSYAPEDASTIRGTKIDRDPGYSNVSELLDSKQGTSLYAALANVLKVSTEDSQSTSPAIKATKVEKLSLSQHPAVFERLQEDLSAKTAISKLNWQSRTAYLITGLLVTDQLSFTESTTSLSSASLDAKLPTKEVAAALGAPGVDIPLEAGGNKMKSSGREGGAGLEGKRIFAIEYRILRKRRLHKGEELTEKHLDGERTFGDDEEGGGAAALDIMFEEDLEFEDEIDDDEERIFDL